MTVTDAGFHIWETRADRPWLPDSRPHLETSFRAEDAIAMMDASGVDRAVLIPPSWPGDFNDYCLQSATEHLSRFAVMGRIAVQKPESRVALESWRDQPGMLGVRLTLNHAREQGWLSDGTTDWFWPAAERLGIPVMVNAPTVLPEIGRVAERHPGLRLIVDHMGRPKGPKDEAIEASLIATTELARHPNVFVKLSLAPTCTNTDYPFRVIQPYLRNLIEAFGPKRSFWGSDATALLSRTRCTYRQNLTLFTDELGLSAEDLAWIMGDGLAECLPWPVHE